MDELDGSFTSFPLPTFPPLSWKSHFHYLNTREGWDSTVISFRDSPSQGEGGMGRFGHSVSLHRLPPLLSWESHLHYLNTREGLDKMVNSVFHLDLRVTAGGRNP